MASEEAGCSSQMSYAFLEAGTVATRDFPCSKLPPRSLGSTEKNPNQSERVTHSACKKTNNNNNNPVTLQIKAYGKHSPGVWSVSTPCSLWHPGSDPGAGVRVLADFGEGSGSSFIYLSTRWEQCRVKPRVGKDPELGMDHDKQALALQGAELVLWGVQAGWGTPLGEA